MYLSTIRIQNFRLLTDAVIDIDEEMTLVVGRNNTAKTSCMQCLKNVLTGKRVSYDDYPLSRRAELYELTKRLMQGELTYTQFQAQIPVISVELTVDYSSEGMEDELGAVSPFILDLESENTQAKILVEYTLVASEEDFRELFQPCFADGYDLDKLRHTYSKVFFRIFWWSVYAVNPLNPQERHANELQELSTLFPFFEIPAERSLGEDGKQKDDPFNILMSNLFDGDLKGANDETQQALQELRHSVDEADKTLRKQNKNLLQQILNSGEVFGYPNAEELQLDVITRLDIAEQLKNQTRLAYVPGDSSESLPSRYNGLGYKNLIKIQFQLAVVAQAVKLKGEACVPLLYIEEPEAHMHPQMQHSFAGHLMRFLHSISDTPIQALVTSHSAHVANNVHFSRIRYAQKTSKGVRYLNLGNFAKKNKKNTDFIQKYLTLSRCDLFFCDKAILVEGASERLLLPDMIRKCKDASQLISQYYTLVEVGGAYAHIFIPFVDFLGVPCLILTDLDSVKPNKDNHLESSLVSQGEKTSNKTLKWWAERKIGKKSDELTLADIQKLTPGQKTLKKCHLEFQTQEQGLTGRSLEESIRNVNRTHYGLPEMATEEDISFKGASKTDFALNLIANEPDYEVPQYIQDGLQWLSKQKIID